MKKDSKINIKTNIYPVPDLSVPFLGVHFTPNFNNSIVSIGPTATPAFGKENYHGMDSFDPLLTIRSLGLIAQQYILNKNYFRNYVHNQAFLSIPDLFFRSAKKLIPRLHKNDIELSSKVGIRSQLFNIKSSVLENDFVCITEGKSTHVLNAVSPAFTASFELADLIINKSDL